MFQDLVVQLQAFWAQLLLLMQNQWLVLLGGSFVFSFIVRFLLGPVRGQEMAGFALAPILCGMMVIVIGQTLFMEPAPGNSWAFAWEWRIEQLILMFAMIGWVLGLVLDILRRPFALSMFFGLLAGVAFCLAFILLLRNEGATLPETFSKTFSFGLISAFVIWRHAQSENGYSVLRVGQVAVASLGLLMVSLILSWTELTALMPSLFLLIFGPGFAVAWMMWTGVSRGSNIGAIGLFGGLSPFLLFLGYITLVSEELSTTAGALIVMIMVGPDLISGFERRRAVSDRVPVLSGVFYLSSLFILYVALIFIAGLDVRS